MDKTTLSARITEIGTCEDEASRRELLAQLQEELNTDLDRRDELQTNVDALTSDNEALRSANMKLFLRVGDHKEKEKEPFEEKEKRQFKDLFNEKGGIK